MATHAPYAFSQALFQDCLALMEEEDLDENVVVVRLHLVVLLSCTLLARAFPFVPSRDARPRLDLRAAVPFYDVNF